MGGRLRADFRRYYGMSFPPSDVGASEAADMAVFLPRDSATWLAMEPQAAHTTEAELLRSVEYSLRLLVWAKTKDGAKNRNRPEPELFRWESKAEPMYEFDVMTVDEANAFLGWDAA